MIIEPARTEIVTRKLLAPMVPTIVGYAGDQAAIRYDQRGVLDGSAAFQVGRDAGV